VKQPLLPTHRNLSGEVWGPTVRGQRSKGLALGDQAGSFGKLPQARLAVVDHVARRDDRSIETNEAAD
jgi:hypothetical protein